MFIGEPSKVLQRLNRVVGRFGVQRVSQYRIQCGIEPENHRALYVQWQEQRIEFFTDIHTGEVHVRAPSEFKGHIRLTRSRDAPHLGHILNGSKNLFDRFRNEVLHFRRRRTFVFGTDGQCGIAQIREKIQLESAQGNRSEEHDPDREHEDGDTTACRGVNEIHG